MCKGSRCHKSRRNLQMGCRYIVHVPFFIAIALVRSKLDYDWIGYNFVFYNKHLMQYTIKAFGYAWELFELLQSTVCIETNGSPLDLRRIKLTLQYIVNLKANIDNHAFDCIFMHNLRIYTTNIKIVLNQWVVKFKSILMTLIDL